MGQMTTTTTIVMLMMNHFGSEILIRKKLVVCTAVTINMYYINYMHKEPCMVSYNTNMCWLTEVLLGH
jgi:hypothetical protein